MFFGAVHMHGGWDSCRSLIYQVLHFLSRSNWDIYVWALELPCGRKYLSPKGFLKLADLQTQLHKIWESPIINKPAQYVVKTRLALSDTHSKFLDQIEIKKHLDPTKTVTKAMLASSLSWMEMPLILFLFPHDFEMNTVYIYILYVILYIYICIVI